MLSLLVAGFINASDDGIATRAAFAFPAYQLILSFTGSTGSVESFFFNPQVKHCSTRLQRGPGERALLFSCFTNSSVAGGAYRDLTPKPAAVSEARAND